MAQRKRLIIEVNWFKGAQFLMTDKEYRDAAFSDWYDLSHKLPGHLTDNDMHLGYDYEEGIRAHVITQRGLAYLTMKIGASSYREGANVGPVIASLRYLMPQGLLGFGGMQFPRPEDYNKVTFRRKMKQLEELGWANVRHKDALGDFMLFTEHGKRADELPKDSEELVL